MRFYLFYLILFLSFFLTNCNGKTVYTDPDKTRHDKWLEDINYFENEYLARSKTYPKNSIPACKEALGNLKLKIDSLTDHQIILELSKCVAMAENGHTTIHLNWMKKVLVRFFWFGDGLFCIKTTDSLSALLGSKVLEINSIGVDEVQERLNPYLSGNTNWKKYTATNYLCSPEVLHGIGISEKESLQLTLLKNNDTVKIKLGVYAKSDNKYEYNAWENLYPTDTSNNWKHVLSDLTAVPLYLQNSKKGAFYYFDYTKKMAYFNINSTWNRGVHLTGLINEFLDSISNYPDFSVITDVRFNTGGNYMLPLKLTKKLPKKLNDNSKIYLITSNMTFSAGLVTAARLKYFAKDKIVIVGEEAGDNLKFSAEAVYYKLPYSGVTIQDSKYSHDWQDNRFVPFRTFWLNLLFGVPAKNLDLDKEIKITFDDYLNGVDPIIDWIFEQNN
jgi:hypothetical protein